MSRALFLTDSVFMLLSTVRTRTIVLTNFSRSTLRCLLCASNFSPGKSKLRQGSSVTPMERTDQHVKLNRNDSMQLLKVELESLSGNEFRRVTSSAVCFLTHFSLSQDSYRALWVLAWLTKYNHWKKDELLNLINDIYFHVHRNLNFKLPEDIGELNFLAGAAFAIRLIERPYYRDLAHRWMNDILMHLRPVLTSEEMDFEYLELILKCLIGLPKQKKNHWTYVLDHETSMFDRAQVVGEVFEFIKKNYSFLNGNDVWKRHGTASFLHMLYRQKFRITNSKDLEFVRTLTHDVISFHGTETTPFISALKADRLYGTLGPEFFQWLMDDLTRNQDKMRKPRTLSIDVLMRLCYLLSAKPYARKYSFFFDQTIEQILRQYNPQSKAKWISVLLLSCMKSNYKPPDVFVRRLCLLFMVSIKPDTYVEQLLNICKALVGLEMVHLGEDVIAQFLQWCNRDSRHSQHISLVEQRQLAITLLKSLQIEHPQLIYKYCTIEGFRSFLYGCATSAKDFTYFKVGFLSNYNSLLEEVLGEGNVTGVRILQFFQDIDHVFMIDNEGNILPAHEIEKTYEMVPESSLNGKDLEPQHLPEESKVTGVENGQPELSRNDLRFSTLDRRNSMTRIWSKRPGHLIHLVLCSRNDDGVLYGICQWQNRLMALRRPKLNTFEIDHIYVAQVIEKLKLANEGDEELMKLRNECIEYIRGVIDVAIAETLKNAAAERVLEGKSCEKLENAV